VNSLKTKIILFWKRASQTLSFLGVKKNRRINRADFDKKLVYGLSPRKLPSGNQLKHLNKFLNPRENTIVKICLLLILINVVYLGTVFIKKHLRYAPVSGGEYIEGVVGYPKTINPLYAVNRDVDSDLSHLIYSSLFKYDQNGNLVNDLAESVTINNDTEYIIKIKNGVKWQNGDKLTVDDILFTIDAIQNSDYRSPLRPSLANVDAEKIDDQTIKITMKPGIADGQVLRVEGKGGRGSNGGQNGDLYITIRIAPHSEFQRRGNDLYCDRPVDLYTAVLGGKARIKTIKDTVNVDITKETPNGKVLRLLGLGMPVYGTKNEFGNMYVTVVIQLPDHLSNQEIELFAKLSALRK